MVGLIWNDRKDEGASPVEHLTLWVMASVWTNQTGNLILMTGYCEPSADDIWNFVQNQQQRRKEEDQFFCLALLIMFNRIVQYFCGDFPRLEIRLEATWTDKLRPFKRNKLTAPVQKLDGTSFEEVLHITRLIFKQKCHQNTECQSKCMLNRK